MQLSDVECQLLHAMESPANGKSDGFCKCDAVLRTALKSAGKWTIAAEHLFNGDYDADPDAFRYYEVTGPDSSNHNRHRTKFDITLQCRILAHLLTSLKNNRNPYELRRLH